MLNGWSTNPERTQGQHLEHVALESSTGKLEACHLNGGCKDSVKVASMAAAYAPAFHVAGSFLEPRSLTPSFSFPRAAFLKHGAAQFNGSIAFTVSKSRRHRLHSSASPSPAKARAAGCDGLAQSHGQECRPSEPPAWLGNALKGVLLLLPWLPMLLSAGRAHAVADSIGSSSLGLRVADFLRRSGWADEAIVFTTAMLPVLELRGAVPIGYWLQLDPWKGYILAVLGNMVPVPIILLYLGSLSDFLSSRSSRARTFFHRLFEKTRRKAGPIQEFQWLGLMLFVAVPFPGTGAWTGAIAAYVLGMPFWNAIWANFFGVVIAGILMNLVVSLGVKSAVIVFALLFLASTFMWTVLRSIRDAKR